MTVRDDARNRHERFAAAVAELDLDYCNNTFGVSPCTAGRVHTGTAQAGAASSITLAAGASAVDDAYKNMLVRITGGTGSGQERTVSVYNGTTKVANVSPDWAAAAVTQAALTSGADAVNATSRVTASVAPTANRLQLLAIHADWAVSQATSPALTITGNGLTWVLIAARNFGPDGANWWDTLYLYRAMGTSPSAGTITINAGAITMDSTAWALSEFGGVPVSGTNGSEAVVQNATNFATTASNLTVTLAAFNNVNNPTYCCFGASDADQVPRTFTPGTGFIEIHDIGAQYAAIGTQWRTDSDTSADTTASAVSSSIAGIAIEIRAATVDTTSTYDVIDRPNACYNTFTTCQDKPNFAKGVKTFKFCDRGMRLPAGELIRPYLADVAASPTEIDPNFGLARRASVSLKLVDAPDTDLDADKYAANRAVPAQGTFWPRLLARNPNYSGRFARVRRGYVVYPWDWATFQTELYVIDSLRGANGSDSITVMFKDPIKIADTVKIPAPTDGKLTADITAAATTLPLGTGKGAQYDLYGYPAWVRIADEVIKIDSRTGDTLNVNASGHAQFNTIAAAHKTNDVVQLCKVYSAVPLTDVLKNLWNLAGLSNTYIDTAGLTVEENNWLGTKYAITTCLAEPETASVLISELVREAAGMQWWDQIAQLLKFKVNRPGTPDAVIPLLTDEANFILDSVSLDVLDAERITYSALYYGRRTPSAKKDEIASYDRADIYIDADAEGANEYNDERASVIKSRWLSSANSLAGPAFVARDIAARRDAPAKLKFKLDPKDYNISLAQLVDVSTKAILDVAGAKKTTRLRITRLADKGTHIECEARTTKYRSNSGEAVRYAYIAANGTADYPTEQVHAHICVTATGKMTNGDAPYLII